MLWLRSGCCCSPFRRASARASADAGHDLPALGRHLLQLGALRALSHDHQRRWPPASTARLQHRSAGPHLAPQQQCRGPFLCVHGRPPRSLDAAPTEVQLEALCREAAQVARSWGWSPADIGIERVMTHAEAASNRDGQWMHENYGPVIWEAPASAGTFSSLLGTARPPAGTNCASVSAAFWRCPSSYPSRRSSPPRRR